MLIVVNIIHIRFGILKRGWKYDEKDPEFAHLSKSSVIACRRCSNSIFILNLTPGVNGLGRDNYKTIRETFMFWDWVRLILENWRYIISNFTSTFRATCISLKMNSKYNYTRSNYNDSCLCPIQWSQVLSHEWRSSWSSADRCCSNYRYIWVINNFIAYLGSIYIKGLKVIKSTFERIRCWTKHLILPILVIILPIISTIPSAKVAEKNKTTVMFIKDTGVNLCKKKNIIIHFLPWRDGPGDQRWLR